MFIALTITSSDHENFYEGRVFGEKMSEVSAHLEDGVMTATIHTPEDTYHIEVKFENLFFHDMMITTALP